MISFLPKNRITTRFVGIFWAFGVEAGSLLFCLSLQRCAKNSPYTVVKCKKLWYNPSLPLVKTKIPKARERKAACRGDFQENKAVEKV